MRAFDSVKNNYPWYSPIYTNSKYSTKRADNTTIIGNWLQRDIGVEVIVSYFEIYYYGTHNVKYAHILTSLTGEDGTWNEIYTIDSRSNGLDVTETYNILPENQIVGRYYRIV